MKKVLLAATILFTCYITKGVAQPNVFDPNDAVVNYNPSNPPVTPPANTIAKWVRTQGLPWNTDKFKAYYYNDMVFRIRFPNGYNPADNTKKYPVILFFHGGGEVAPTTDNERQLFNGAERFQGMIDANQFNAFLVFPQQKVLGWDYSYMMRINDVMDSLQKYCNTDPDRVISMGLSAGGYGAMLYTIAFSQRVASTIAASPALIDILNQNPASFVHIPFWLSSGGTDGNPNPTVTQNFVDSFTNKGGIIRYNFYPTIGHNTWESQWNEPYLLPTWLAAHKANPLIYFNRSKFSSASTITAKLGISPGFQQYQWQKDGMDLAGASSNEYFPTQFGSYRVRFKRTSTSNWSDWSPNPAVISQDNIAPTTPLNLKSVFTGRTIVNLDWSNSMDNDSVTNYEVFVNGVKKYTTGESSITADKLTPNTSYVFTVRALDQAGNASAFSNPVTASTSAVTNGLNYRYYEGNWTVLPNFNALTPVKVGVSANTDISTRTAGVNNLFGYVWEGYINIKTPGTYTFETNSDDGSKLYFNSFYSPATKALVNNDGAHAAWTNSGSVSIPTAGLYPIAITFFDQWNAHIMEAYWTGPGFSRSLIPDSVFLDTNINVNDTTAPSVPLNLKVINTGASFLDLDWDNSTDNTAVSAYDIYINGVKKYTSATSNVIANNLLPNTTYSVSIKALDKAGNASAFSAVIAATTSATATGGLKYKYYEGSWSTLPDFSTLTPVKTGSTPNIDLTVRTAGVDYNYAFVWEGNINITTPGTYIFETVSDDGSRFYFNKYYSPAAVPLADNDGIHAPQSATGTVTIPTAGPYPVSITYFQKDGGANMQIYWTGPGIARQLIPNSAFAEIVSGDVTAPTAPANLTSYNTGNTFVTLDWDNSTDNTSVAGYDIYVNNVKKYSSVESAITADGLTPNTSYVFTVKALDPSGNVSGISNALTIITAPASSGLQYRYYEGDWDVLPNFNTLTPVKSGLTANVDIITPRNRSDMYGLVWEGYIKIPIAGTYTFETNSDDGSKLYFNTFYSPSATALVDNDGLHAGTSVTGTVAIAAPGVYPISIVYFQKGGGASMNVYWSGPGIPRQQIPNIAFTNPSTDVTAPSVPANLKVLYTSKTYVNLDWDNSTDNVGVTAYDIYVNNVKTYTTVESAFTADKLQPGTSYTFTVKAVDQAGNNSAGSMPLTGSTTSTVAGLNYRYYEGSWNALPNFNALTPLKYGPSATPDISARTPGVNDNFAFVWEGYLNFTYAGTYTFELVSDEGSKFYFNSFYSTTATPIINDDGLHGPTSVSATVTVPTPGLYPLSLVYFEKTGGESLQLFISGGPGGIVPRQEIPAVAYVGSDPATLVQSNAVSIVNAGNVMADITGTTNATDKIKSLKAYPNPMSDWLNIDFYVASQANDIGIDMFDVNGKVVYKNNFKALPAGNNTLKINVGDGKMASGVYFVKVNVNGIPSKVIKLYKSRK
jgi:chitodextrinase/pimeloyl-ACP methyl ester carboxylesterase